MTMMVSTIIAILESMTKEPKLHLHHVVGNNDVTLLVTFRYDDVPPLFQLIS